MLRARGLGHTDKAVAVLQGQVTHARIEYEQQKAADVRYVGRRGMTARRFGGIV
jgi:hypothetical protein